MTSPGLSVFDNALQCCGRRQLRYGIFSRSGVAFGKRIGSSDVSAENYPRVDGFPSVSFGTIDDDFYVENRVVCKDCGGLRRAANPAYVAYALISKLDTEQFATESPVTQ